MSFRFQAVACNMQVLGRSRASRRDDDFEAGMSSVLGKQIEVADSDAQGTYHIAIVVQ